VQEFHLIDGWRVRRDQMVAVQHDVVINTLGERRPLNTMIMSIRSSGGTEGHQGEPALGEQQALSVEYPSSLIP
jgi:hypothetical protein